jgi:hypothetical protein
MTLHKICDYSPENNPCLFIKPNQKMKNECLLFEKYRFFCNFPLRVN